jgi:glycosyltransferase involved in cell wall biosynthesis
MDTWVLCAEDCRRDIESWLATHGEVPGVHFVFVRAPKLQQVIERFAYGPFHHNYFAYSLWHRRAYKVAERLHEQLRFDIAHHANTCGYREPSFLWKLDIPFVWGPVGGTQNYPWRFLTHAGLRGALIEATRTVANQIQLRTGRRVRKAMRRADVVLAANSTGVRDIERVYAKRPHLLLETGLHAVAAEPREFSESRPLRILWSGELKPHKGLHLLLAALGALRERRGFTLRVLGRGPLAASLRRMAEQYGIADSCEFMGWRPFTEAVAQYDWADVLAFTSLRDTSGNVMLEAMSRGVPVICLGHQGAADIVTDQCGFKVAVRSPNQVIGELRDTIAGLIADREPLRQRSGEALARARHFLWERNGREMAAVYESVLAVPATKSSRVP